MKKFTLLLLCLAQFTSFSQNWKSDFYAPATTKSNPSFYHIQSDFNGYWQSYNIRDGYYHIDGVKYKAAGWKQFKRWEWYWETRIDRKTGEFPAINILDIQRDFLKSYSPKSDESSWQSMGPGTSDGGYAGIGRINCIAFHPTNPNIMWVGAPSGGLWKTTNGGDSWETLTDNLPVIGVSEIVVANDYDESKTLYIATGDRDAGDNYSIGVLKTTDDGQTWQTTGLNFNVSQRYRVTRLLANPNEQSTMYASTNGGIYKTTNGGNSWIKKIDGVFFDMEFKPNCEDTVLYAVTSDYWGAPAVFKTKDAGENWKSVYSFPSTAYRVELDVAPSDSTIIYALASNRGGGMDGIYKSFDSGETFSKIYEGTTAGNNLLNWFANSTDAGGQGWYDLTLSVSPSNANTIYLGGINTWRSNDGGLTWQIVNHWYGYGGKPAVHADKHYMEFRDKDTFFEANDGGIYKTTDWGLTWTDITNGMVISQMYKLGVSQTVKDEVITGLQDNGSKLIHSGSWRDVKGGDGMECLIDYTDDKVQYATYVYGQIDRTTDRWVSWYNTVNITDNIPGGANGAWVTPYIIDPVDSKTLYLGYSDVWKTTNRGNSWTKISTLNLSNKIRSMAIAPSDNKWIYITDYEKFYRTTNGGTNWENLTSHLPSTSNAITYIWVDAIDPMLVWITLGGYDSKKAYESTDGGKSWTDISAGLPSVPANTIINNKLSKSKQLYAGTDIGVFFREGDSDWQLFSKNLPSVIVTELEIYYDNTAPSVSVLYASTYGRGLWKSNLSSFQLPEILINNIQGPYYVSDENAANLNISFTLNSTFTDNTFTAYLSDKNGSFESPTTIGTLQTIQAGTLQASIPAGSQSGTRYKVKLVSSNPEFESSLSNPFTVVLDNQAPSVNITSTQSSSTSSNNFDVKITFSEPVTGFVQSDIVVGNATINTFNFNNAPDYSINISPESSGLVTVDVPAGVAYDVAGNLNTEAQQWSITYTPTSVAELADHGIKLYPNPTSGIVKVDFSRHYANIEIIVLDLEGRTLTKSMHTGTGTHNIDLTGIAKGVYIVKIKLNNKELNTRVVVR